MKTLLHIFLTTIIALSCACCHFNSSVDGVLSEAEMLMAEHPDSSLALLEAVNPSELRSESSRALYGLLLTQAHFKNYAPPQDDSLITVVADYYEGAGRDDSPHRMLANYYYGRTRLNEKDYAKSLFAFFNAYELATADADPFWAAMAAERISEIYRETYNYKEMQKFAEIELQNFRKFGNPLYVHDGLLDMAMAYHCNEKYDSAITIYKQLIDTVSKYGDTQLSEVAMRNIALSFFSKEQFDSAEVYYRHLCKSSKAKATDSLYLGMTLLRIGEVDKANDILRKIRSIGQFISTDLKFEVFLAMDSIEQALNASRALLYEMDSIIGLNINQNLSGTLYEYHEYRLKTEMQHRRMTKMIAWLIGLCAIILMSGLIYASYRYIHSQRKIIDRNVKIAENLQDMLMDKDRKSNETIVSMMGDRFEILNHLCRLMYETPNKTQARRKISNEIEALIEQFSSDKRKINELEQYVNNHYDGIMMDFRRSFPDLMESEYLLFLYSIYGFSSSAIALFLGLENVSGVYDRRKRLKKKIKAISGGKQQIFIQVLS